MTINKRTVTYVSGICVFSAVIISFAYQSFSQLTPAAGDYELLASASEVTASLARPTSTQGRASAGAAPSRSAAPVSEPERVIRTVVFVQPSSTITSVAPASSTPAPAEPVRTLKVKQPKSKESVSKKETVKKSEPTATAPIQSGPVSLRITEVVAGTEASAEDEFIEIYNDGDSPVTLTGFYIKKRSSTGVQTALVSAARLKDKVIPARSYFLIVHEGAYQGGTSFDASWPASYSLAYTNNAVVLYDPSGAALSEVSWTELAKGESTESGVSSPRSTTQ